MPEKSWQRWVRRPFDRAREPQKQGGSGARNTQVGESAASQSSLPASIPTGSESQPNVSTAVPWSEPIPLQGSTAAATDTVTDVTTSPEDGTTLCPPERLWDRAYDTLKNEQGVLVGAYEKILSSQLEHGIGSSVPEAQSNIIAQHDPDTRRRQMVLLVHAGLDRTAHEAKVKKGIGTGIRSVLALKDDVSSAIQAVPQAALAWGTVCIAMEVLVNPIKQTETNRDSVIQVIQTMDWYWSFSSSLFEKRTGNTDELSEVRCQLENQIVDLYKALLSYQIKSVYSYYRHRGLVFLRDMVKLDDWDGDQKAILDAEARFRQYTKAYTTQQTNSHLQLANSHLEQLVNHAKHQETIHMSGVDQKCLTDVRSATDPYHDKIHIERIKGGLFRDVSCWILDNPDFLQWLGDPKCPLFWIKGDPGKGKTMLLCGIINELTSTSFLSYFFCQASDARFNNATAVVRGLIYLLVDQQPSLISHVRKKYNDAGERNYSDANAWDVLSEIFTNILRDPDLRAEYIVIDALDECIKDLSLLLELVVELSSVSHIKWIVSSRNSPDIEHQLTHAEHLTLEINNALVSHAVDVYIDHKVSKLMSVQHDQDLQAQVRQGMRQKADGTFLWVALVFKELQDRDGAEYEDASEILKVLDEMPRDLAGLYSRMMSQIGLLRGNDTSRCHTILETVVLAYRPPNLLELPKLVGFTGNLTRRDTLERLVNKCGSFLTIRDSTVYFVHLSAKDYLVESTTLFPSGPDKTHYNIFFQSLKLMQAVLERDMYRLNSPGCLIDQVAPPNPDPLAIVRYSCVYWADHLCEWLSRTTTGKEDLRDGGLIHTFLETKYLYWLEALSLLRSMSDGVFAMRKLENLEDHEKGKQLAGLIRDAQRFILSHKWIIENAPLQAYSSALVFCPVHSKVREFFKAEEPDWITTKPLMEADWNACLHTLDGHRSRVMSVAFSADGQQLASGSSDSIVKIWDATTGACIRTFRGHSSSVNLIAFSPDGRWVALGGYTVEIWDTATGICAQTLKDHSYWVRSVAFSADGQRVALGSAYATGSYSQEGTIKIWNITTDTCVQTPEGIGWSVESVAFSPDGNWVASDSGGHLDDNTVKIWDASTGACVQTFKVHSSPGKSVTFSADGRRVASGDDNTVNIWDVATSDCIQTLKGHRYSVNSVAFLSDNQHLVSGSNDCSVKIWNTETGMCVRTFEGHGDSVNSVAVSPNGNWVASGSGGFEDDNTIKVWDAAMGAYVRSLDSHSPSVRLVVFSADGQLIASASGDSRSDNTVKIWDAATGACLRSLEGHRDRVDLVVFSADSRLMASSSYHDTVRIWNTNTGACIQTFELYPSFIAFSADNQQVVLCDKKIQILDIATRACAQTFEGHGSSVKYSTSVKSVAFSADGQYLASGSEDHTVKIWDTATGACIRTLGAHRDSVNSVAFSGNGRWIASGSGGSWYDDTVKIWDALTGDCAWTLEGHHSPVKSVAFSTDGRYVVSGSSDSRSYDDAVKIWDVTKGVCVWTLENTVSSVAFSTDGQWIVSGSTNSIKILDAVKGVCVKTLEGSWVNSVAFSADSQWVVSGSGSRLFDITDDNVVKVWDVATGACLRTLYGHDSPVNSVAFSADDRWVVSGSDDHKIRIWDAVKGTCLQTLDGHSSSVNSVAFSADGQSVVSGSGSRYVVGTADDNAVKIWNVATGACLQTLYGHSFSVKSVAFSADSQHVASGSSDHTLRIWNAATGACIRTLGAHYHSVNLVAFSADGRWVASGCSHLKGGNSTVKIWETATGTCMQTLVVGGVVTHLSFDPTTNSRLFTNIGILELDLRSPDTQPAEASLLSLSPYGYGISADSAWIVKDGKNMLWLPPEYRASSSAVMGSTITIGCRSGRVLVMRFS